MSLSDQFSATEKSAVMPWQFPAVNSASLDDGCEIVDDEMDSADVLTAGQIEAVQLQAYEEAAEEGRKNGYDQGYQEGYSAGEAKAIEEGKVLLEEQAGTLSSLLRALHEPFRELDEQVEQELVNLAMAAAKQLIRRELKIDPGQVIAAVREAMDVLPSSARDIRLFLHPEDAQLVNSSLSLEDADSGWIIVEDPLMTRGGCRVETATSRIDASVEKRIAAVVAKALGGDRSEDGS